MSSLEYASLQPIIEFQLPYMFANSSLIEKKVDILKIIKELTNGKDEISVNVQFPAIITKQQPAQNLKIVIKVRKFRNKRTGEIITKPEVVGIVKDVYSYEALADFRFEPKFPEQKLIDFMKSIQNLDYLSNGKENPKDNYLNQLPYRALSYSIQPGVFSKNQNNYILPHRFLFEDVTAVNKSIKEKKEDKTRFLAKYIHFGDQDTPQPEPLPDSLKDRPEFLFIKQKFEERPIWLKNSLIFASKDKIKFESYHLFKKYLFILTGLIFKDGPWKHTYVRFGYDPRAEPTSFIYQVIDVGVLDNTTKYESLVQSYKRNEFETYDPSFSEPPTKLRQIYQLVDLQDQAILDILEKERGMIERSDDIQCNKKTGWINPKSFKGILKFMKSKFKIG